MDLTTIWDCFPRPLSCWAGSLWASGSLVRYLRRAGARRHPVKVLREPREKVPGEPDEGCSSGALRLPAPGPHPTGDRILGGTCRRKVRVGRGAGSG